MAAWPRQPSKDIFIGRQPICDANLSVCGYELLYRTGESAQSADFADGDRASARVAFNAFLEIGLERIAGDALAFLNVTRSFLIDGYYRALPRKQLVLEVLEDIQPNDRVLRVLREASNLGYRIALDDFVLRSGRDALLELADIVKVDVLALPRAQVESYPRELAGSGITLLAEKVETYEEFERCRTAGYDWFQGYFFCRPKVLREKAIPSDRLTLLQIISRLNDPEVEIEELEQLVERSVGLSYKLIRYVNSARYALPAKIDSIRRALVMLGLAQIRSCVTLLLLADLDDKPTELMVTALVRARMCQLLSEKPTQAARERNFLIGLMSVLDAMLDQPMDVLLEDLALAEEVKQALLARAGPGGLALRAALACESGAWDELMRLGLRAETVSAAYLKAIAWAKEAQAEL
jgi:EAL and modified HD-GYP domain-containing signal transduction protein